MPDRPRADPSRVVAHRLLRTVDHDGAYANLALPKLIDAARLTGRDAAFATELGYGTLRAVGTLDAILAACIDRPLDQVEAPVRDILRLGAYQALRTRIPPHAAVATTVDLARATGNSRAAGFVNAVARKVARRTGTSGSSGWATTGRRWNGWPCAPPTRNGSPRPSTTRSVVTWPRPRPRSSPTTGARRPTWSPGRG